MPAKNDGEKYRIAGITMHSRNAWTIRQTRLVHPFHRPHPRKETNKGAVKSVRKFLEAAGVKK